MENETADNILKELESCKLEDFKKISVRAIGYVQDLLYKQEDLDIEAKKKASEEAYKIASRFEKIAEKYVIDGHGHMLGERDVWKAYASKSYMKKSIFGKD